VAAALLGLLSGQEYPVPGAFIANVVDGQVATMPIARDGSFSVTNARNGFTKNYVAR
jgi:hypothetical protein